MKTISINLRRQINLLVWGARLARLVMWASIPLLIWALWNSKIRSGWWFAMPMLLAILHSSLSAWLGSVRRQFIRDARLPSYLGGKLRETYPHVTVAEAELVLRGLRQFFMAHSRSGHQFVAMPSKAVDAAWHEFILHTHGYAQWCEAAFGKLLHHTPAEVLGKSAQRNDGLRRSWFWSCKEESIDPRKPTRLPLLFAIDKKLAISGGFSYVPDCKSINAASGSDAHCGTSFGDGSHSSDSSSSDSFGGAGASSSDGASDGGSDGGSGCGGGCGGGGGD